MKWTYETLDRCFHCGELRKIRMSESVWYYYFGAIMVCKKVNKTLVEVYHRGPWIDQINTLDSSMAAEWKEAQNYLEELWESTRNVAGK
jgi:hypothetical protein